MKRAKTRPRGLIFDLDGTLIDSVRDVSWVAAQGLSAVGLVAPTEQRIREMIGDGLASLVQRAYQESQGLSWEAPVEEPKRLAVAIAAAREAYDREPCREAIVFAGVFETLSALQGQVQLGVVTNKPARVAEQVLQQLQLAAFFSDILGADSLPEKKPHPMPLSHLQTRWKLSSQDIVMIGDHKNDFWAGTAAKMRTGLVTYGYTRPEDLRSLRPEFLFETPQALRTLLRESALTVE